jgi:uncharacterized protein YkwD
MKRVFFLFIFCLGGIHYPLSADPGTQPRIDVAKMEQQIHQLINRERQSQGLAPLAWDEQLTAIARDHSLDMARHHFFSHTNLKGENATVRAKKRGWNKKKRIGPNTWLIGLAENIFLNHLYDKVVKTVQAGVTFNQEYVWNSQEKIAHSTVQGWMKSPSHRKNILSPVYDRHGIGVAISGSEVLITEDLF